jgi:hypothetical protein
MVVRSLDTTCVDVRIASGSVAANLDVSHYYEHSITTKLKDAFANTRNRLITLGAKYIKCVQSVSMVASAIHYSLIYGFWGTTSFRYIKRYNIFLEI